MSTEHYKRGHISPITHPAGRRYDACAICSPQVSLTRGGKNLKKTEKSMNIRVWLLCASACYIIAGIVLLIFPAMQLDDFCYAIGIFLMILGAVNVAWYFVRQSYQNPDSFGLSIGAAEFLVGLFAVLKTTEFTYAFSQILAVSMVFDSIIKLQYSMDLLRLKSPRWWWLLVVSVVMGAGAMAILLAPFPDNRLRLTFTYAVMIADGAANIAAALLLSARRKQMARQDGMGEN